MENQLICGDALEELRKLPDDSADCIITSPPYYGLRSYLAKENISKAKEIGSETSLEKHLEVLLRIMAEIRRVLKPAGSFWLNYGDCYGTGSGAGSRKNTKQASNRGSDFYEKTGKQAVCGYEKSLLMIPERIALRMIENGWILRSKIIWAKQVMNHKDRRTFGSSMPASAKDRFNSTWEYLYHFVKNKKYYFNLDAVRLPLQTLEKRACGIDREKDYPNAKRNAHAFNYRVRDAVKKTGNPQYKASEKEIKKYTENYIAPAGPKMGKDALRQEWSSRTPNWGNVLGKNLPNVWFVPIEPSKELHFARFPQALCEIPIKSSCPSGGIVLDPFCGSGTALIMAQKLGHKYIGIDLNLDYLKIAQRLLAQKLLL